MCRHIILSCAVCGVRASALPEVKAGHLFLVVGPSGAGKDSLLDAARRHFADTTAYLFPSRIITRPADAASEAHIPIDPDAFAILAESGGFALHWQAHGHRYGIPMAIRAALRDGQHVVVNVSRTMIDAAREQFSTVHILSVIADPAILAARLNTRGRETGNDLETRLARAHLSRPAGDDVTEIDNSGDLAESTAAFIAAIEAVGTPATLAANG